MNRKLIVTYFFLVSVFIFCAGCGETVRGMSKDAHRVGRGAKTMLVADESSPS